MDTYLTLAADEAGFGIRHGHGGPFGAVIVKNRKVLASAHNEVVLRNDPTAHAEVLAIRYAAKKLSSFSLEGTELYTTAEPCPMCLAAILWARIDKVYFACSRDEAAKAGFDDSKFYDILENIDKQNVITLRQIDSGKCNDIFEKYRNKEDKTLY